MENISLLFDGFQAALTLENLLAAFAGAIIGMIVGAMPGIEGLTAVALLLPLTFKVPPTTSIICLAALYYSTMYGGSFSSILLNIPGDSPAIMTALDGYPLAKQGKAGKALGTSTISSFIGGTIGIVILTVCAPLLAQVGLKFGSPELALLIIFALTSIGWLLGENAINGLIATGLGIILSTIGVDLATGLSRNDFGRVELSAGFPFISLIIGMFGFSQIIEMILHPEQNMQNTKFTIRESMLNREEIKRIIPASVRQGVLGTFIGVMPGAGATTSAFLSYIFEKRINKNRAQMGKGAIEGVAAAESSNNAAAAGAFAPLLTLGIPGSATTAILLGGLIMWGLRPGPLLFTDHPEFVWPLIASMYVGNVICLIIAFAFIPILVRVITVPTSLMVPTITALCVLGAYSTNNNMFDVFLMVIAGTLSYFLGLSKIPIAPLLLAFVLTPMLEKYMRQSFDMTRGDASIFLRNGICWSFIILTIALCISPMVLKLIKSAKGVKNSETLN
ncbi:MAG: transporter [Clostridiales bacterium]|jgi:putative tricarboxylic transport membrane protein|nr:transporter [Clostridiales bacterium]